MAKLLPVITSFASVAISNAELYSTAREQASELHQIISIASELGSISDVEQFMRRFIQRASDFLGFRRSFVGLIEEGKVQIRWSYVEGKHGPAGYVVPEGILTRAIHNKQVFWADDATQTPGANQEILAEFKVRQLLAVPLLGTGGEPLGMFGALDRADEGSISQEDIRRAQALAAPYARWRASPMNGAQVNLLRRLGITAPEGATKGEASDLITVAKAAQLLYRLADQAA